MESLKAAAAATALPKDHRPIKRLGVMSQIEMYNVPRVTRVHVLASFERAALNAEAQPGIGPSADRIPPVGAAKRRIKTKNCHWKPFRTL